MSKDGNSKDTELTAKQKAYIDSVAKVYGPIAARQAQELIRLQWKPLLASALEAKTMTLPSGWLHPH